MKTQEQPKRLYKSQDNKVLAGVLGGIGEYLNVDPVIIRVIYIFLTVMTAFMPGVFAYILIALVVPKKVNR